MSLPNVAKFVEQEDRHLPLLTVRESLTLSEQFQASVRLCARVVLQFTVLVCDSCVCCAVNVQKHGGHTASKVRSLYVSPGRCVCGMLWCRRGAHIGDFILQRARPCV